MNGGRDASMRPYAWVAWILTFAVGAGADGVSWDHTLRGYAKDSASLLRDTGSGREWVNTTRLRTKLRWFAAARWTLGVDADLALTTGSLLDNDVVRRTLDREQWINLAQVLVDRDRLVARHTVDRLYGQYYGRRIVVTAGRQRVAWGVSDVFRPLDQFSPFAPEAVDKQERAGIDAVRLSVPLGRLSNAEVIHDPEGGRYGARLRTHVGRFDVSAVGGRFRHGRAMGAAVAGDIGETGVRAEGLINWGKDAQVTVGGAHGFAWRNLTLSGEIHFDGGGARDPVGYDWLDLLRGRRLTLARRYLAVAATGLATPLLQLSVTTLVNVDDRSRVIQPGLGWDAGASLDIRCGAQWFVGATNSEFGARGDGLFGIVTRYF